MSNDETRKTSGRGARILAGVLLAGQPSAAGPAGVSDEPLLEEGEVLAGRYRILRFLARGGMGEVYRARDEELHEDIALKTLRQDLSGDAAAMEQFKREIQLARQVTHPSVCRIFDLGADQELAFYTMELVEGETLSEVLARGPLPPAEALAILEQVAAGLDAAHDAGVIHRDLKPANILVVPGAGARPRAVIADFGIARRARRAAAGLVAGDASEGPVGTPAYMAPEQLAGDEVTPRVDIYALGMVAYEMVTGRRPFATSATFADALARLRQPPVGPRAHRRTLPRRWDEAILRCLAARPQDRFARAAEAVAALRGPARPRWPWILGSVAVLGVAVAAGLVFARERPTRELTERRLTGVSGFVDPAALSPDGRLLAFAVPPDPAVQLLDLERSETRRLGGSAAQPRSLAWFPDGASLLVASAGGLHRVPVAGGDPILLRAGDVKAGAVTRDGRELAYTEREAIWLARVDGGAPRRLADNPFPGDPLPLAFAPGDHRVLFVHQARGQAPEIRSVDRAGGEATALRDVRLQLNVTTSYVAWLADGRVVYTLREEDGTSLWELDVDPTTGAARGAPRRRKVDVAHSVVVQNASRDGRLAVVPVELQADVYLASLTDAAAPRRLTHDLRDDDPVAFTADGQELLIASNRGGPGVWRQTLGTGETRLLARGGGDFQVSLTPDGASVLLRREIPGGIRFVRAPLDGSPAVELFDFALPPGTSVFAARHRCGRAGCFLGLPASGRLELRRIDLDAGAIGPTVRAIAPYGPWDLARDGDLLAVADARTGELRAVAIGDGASRSLGQPPCVPQQVRWAPGGRVVYACGAPAPTVGVLDEGGGHRTVWTGEATIGSLAVAPDGASAAVGLTAVEGNVWLLEGL